MLYGKLLATLGNANKNIFTYHILKKSWAFYYYKEKSGATSKWEHFSVKFKVASSLKGSIPYP